MTQQNPTYPSTVYTLGLVGIIFQVIGLVFSGFGMMMFPFGMMGGYRGWMTGGVWYGEMMTGHYGSGFWYGWMVVWIVIGIVVIALGLYGLRLVSSRNVHSLHTGSVLLLVASLIAFPMMWGLFVGSALLLAAAIIGLTWQPSDTIKAENNVQR